MTIENTGPYDEAAGAIRRHEERFAKDASSFATLADLYRKTGRHAEAAALCREGLERFPDQRPARYVLVKALLAAGDLDGAEVELNAMLASHPEDPESHRLLAESLRRRGDVDAAVRHLEAAVAADPDDREARTTLALLKGVPSTESGVGRVLRDDTFVTAAFGTICLDQGLHEEAAIVFTRLLRRDPTDGVAREGLERTIRARSGRRRG